VRIVNVRLHGPWESERWGRKCWVFELVFTIRAPRGAKVPGKYIVIPRIKREGKWVDYAPVISPPINFMSRLTFAPIYVETYFESYIYVYGGDRHPTSAIGGIDEPFELLIEVVTDSKEYRGTIKKVRLQKLIRKYQKKVRSNQVA
jgi:hypothetical protein